jgi:dipeptidyl aminopeptidase/acylaminoacyl peptidase
MKPARIPLWKFFKDFEKQNFQVSPDGNRITYLKRWHDHWHIFVQTGPRGRAKPLSPETGEDVTDYFWKTDNHLIYARGTQFYRLDVSTGASIDLSFGKDAIFNVLPNIDGLSADQVLIQVPRKNPDLTDVYLLDVSSPDPEPVMVAEHPDPIIFGVVQQWIVNNSGDVCAALSVKGTKYCLLTRANSKSAFGIAREMDFRYSICDYSIVASGDGKSIYAISAIDSQDTNAAVMISAVDGREVKCFFRHPTVDLEEFAVWNGPRPAYVSFNDPKLRQVALDPQVAPILETLTKKLRGYFFKIMARDKAEKKFIVRARTDRVPAKYYLLDVSNPQRHRLTFVANIAPWLKERDLCRVTQIEFTAGDGLKIEGYLTLPRVRGRGKIPLILNVHGGPENRNYWDFDPIYSGEVQFFANRGYAVLQINFRGSIGYGRSFWEKGFRQHGRDMQKDLTDAVHWLLDQRNFDPKRIAIFGRSYGGYAALAGVTFTPEMYQAAISYDGVTNWLTWLGDCVPPTDPLFEQFCIKVGNPTTDGAYLEAVAPALHANKIKKPIFIAHGALDEDVPKSESDQMIAAVHRADTNYMVKANEGHTFQGQENKMEFYAAVERFLAKALAERESSSAKPNRA